MNTLLKINDLMIDDIVLAEAIWYDDEDEEHIELHPFRVGGVSETDSIWIDGYEGGLEGEWLDGCKIEKIGDIYGMPFTKETAIANGFEIEAEGDCSAVCKLKTEDAVIAVFLIGDNYVVNVEHNIEFDGTYAVNSAHKCGRFIHEYQHALRDCELKDLANKMKVKP